VGKYRYVGSAAGTVVQFGSKDEEHKLVPVGTGDFVDLTDSEAKHESNKDMIDSGVLIDASTSKSKESKGGEE
jgi:hypothetical protein